MAALAHNPIRKSWKREWPVIAVENPVSDEEKLRYARIASDFAQRAGVNDWVETKLKGSGRVAEAFITESDEKVIKSPATTTPYTLYMFLHEAGHHFYDHVNNEKPYHVEEYEATHKALEILEENRIALPCEATEEAGWNVEQAIKKDRKKGIKIEPKAEELVARLKECTAVNPTMKRLFDFGGYMVLDEEGLPVHTGRDLSKTEALQIAKDARKAGEKVHLVRSNPAVSAEQYRLAQAVLSGTARDAHMPVSVAREIVDRTPAKLRSEYSKYTNPGGVEVELTKHHHFLPFNTKKAAETMKRLLQAEGVKAKVKRVDGEWGVDHTHANPFYGTDLDLETSMAPAWVYYGSKQERDTAARMYEGRGKQVVLGHSMFGFKEGEGKKWRLRGVDHRGNPNYDADIIQAFHDWQSNKAYITRSNWYLKGDFESNDPKLQRKHIAPWNKKIKKTFGSYEGFIKAQREYLGLEPYRHLNPQSSADDMYASFHGEPTDETIEFQNEEHYHSHLAALGELVELKVKLVNGGTAVIGFEIGEESAVNPNKKRGQYKAPGSRRGFWPFNAFTHTTIYHVGPGKKQGVEKTVKVSVAPKTKVVGEFKGYKIEKQPEGYVAPGIDPAVFFSRMDDVKLFILSIVGGGKLKANPLVDHYREWRARNPGPFHEAGKLFDKGTRAARKPMNDFIGAAGKVGGYLDDELGRAFNPKSHDTGPAYLTSNEDGTALMIVGGDQSLDLPDLGITGDMATKESIVIGEITNIVYHARKVFGGKPEQFDYTHRLGETTGDRPMLIYDRVNQKLSIAGGAYKIERPLGETSPGIEN